jgi:hypothetical protein
MSAARPFIPRDKPKFFVVGVLSGLCGLGSGVAAFAAAALAIPPLKTLCLFLFFVCWLAFAISWFGCLIGYFSGRYEHLATKPWREQVW